MRTTNAPGAARRRLACALLLPTCCACGAVTLTSAQAAATKAYTLNASGELKRTKKLSNVAAIQSGPIRGTPFGTATMTLNSSLKQATVTSKFTVRTAFGLVNGRATARLTIDGDTSTYKGTATITGGTKRYKRITGARIRFTGQGPVSAKSTKITLSGTVRY